MVLRPDDDPTAPAPAPGSGPDAAAADREETEQRQRLSRALGAGYELRRLIGHGGFATVYAAHDTQLKRDVAVKVLRPELAAAPAMRERFRREAEAVARLRHPHVIPIYAVGEGEGLAWYVMPLVVGESLRTRLDREGRLPAAEVRRILLESAGALAEAHRAGLVHRDIKPDNIMLDGVDARVLLTDFGIAKALRVETQGLTATGVVIGTPQYMSPEQASGEAVDARSDLYSLGVVAYQMLAGELPFAAGTVAALLVKQMVEEAPSVTRKRPDCPADLAAVVTRCLAKSPEQRWTSADHLIQALAVTTTPTAEQRRSGARAAVGIPEPLYQFRVAAGVILVGVVTLAAVDVLAGRVLFAPLGLLVGAFVVAAQYGRLWTAGYSWRDVFTWRRAATPDRSPVPLDSAEFGPHYVAIQQARTDRAGILAMIERAPKSERALVADVIPAVDRAVARAAELARQLHAVERQIEPGPEELDRRLAATRAEPPSPGREQRMVVLERRRQAVQGLVARRVRLAAQLEATCAVIGRVRLELEQAGPAGISGGLAAIQSAAAELQARAQDTVTG